MTRDERLETGTKLRINQLPTCRRHGELRIIRHIGAKGQRHKVPQYLSCAQKAGTFDRFTFRQAQGSEAELRLSRPVGIEAYPVTFSRSGQAANSQQLAAYSRKKRISNTD